MSAPLHVKCRVLRSTHFFPLLTFFSSWPAALQAEGAWASATARANAKAPRRAARQAQPARSARQRTASCAAPASCPRACSWRAGVCPAAGERRDAPRPRQLLLRMTPQRAAPEGGSAEGARSLCALRAPGRCSGAYLRDLFCSFSGRGRRGCSAPPGMSGSTSAPSRVCGATLRMSERHRHRLGIGTGIGSVTASPGRCAEIDDSPPISRSEPRALPEK